MEDKVSALMDGELDPDDAAVLVEQFAGTDGLHEQWAVYHLISDALGQSEVRPFNISRRVSARLASEPAILAIPGVSTLRPAKRRKPVAYAAAASIAAVAVAGWMSLQTTQGPDPLQQHLAGNQPTPAAALPAIPVAVSVPASVPASAPAQINDYLLAHREFSPSTAMHGVAPYMRTAAESRENFAR